MRKFHLFTILILILVFVSCKDNLPENPTFVSPISGLIVNVAGLDYTAAPKVETNGALSDSLFINVRVPAVTGTVKQITLANTDATASVAEGSSLTFTNNVTKIDLTTNKEVKTYYLKMVYREPPFMYFIKTSDKDDAGVKYFLKKATAPKIASGSFDDNYEGYVDLSATNWDNIGLVKSDLSITYNVDGGWWPEQSSGSFTLMETASPGTGYFPTLGPWADWKWYNSNPAIVSPGIWKINYNTTTKLLSLLEVQFAVIGTAIGSQKAMVYNTTTKTWSLTTPLNAGSIKFITIPVASGDPTVTIGEYSTTGNTGNAISLGNNIKVAENGTYTIQLNLSKPPYYTYTMNKN